MGQPGAEQHQVHVDQCADPRLGSEGEHRADVPHVRAHRVLAASALDPQVLGEVAAHGLELVGQVHAPMVPRDSGPERL